MNASGLINTGRWRLALRTGRRLAWRSRGRTLLIALLVSVPAAGGAFLDTYFHTQQLSPQERTTRTIGQADAWVMVTDEARITNLVVGGEYLSWNSDYVADSDKRDPATVDVPSLLPDGARLVPFDRATVVADIAFDLGDRTVSSTVVQARPDPVFDGMLRLRDGRMPDAAGEVALTAAMSDRLGLSAGDTATLADGAEVQVVGVYVHPGNLSSRETIAADGWRATPAESDASAGRGYLVALPDGAHLAPEDVQRAAGQGVVIKPRDAFLHPDGWIPAGSSIGRASSDGIIGGLVAAGLAAIEVVLLAGTAFAVGVRRQLRDAALILANGGRPSDVRRVVIAQGVVIGLVGTVAGTALGVLGVAALRPLPERYSGMEFGGVLVSLPELAAIAAVGLGAGVLASLAPAIGAGRLCVVDALAGRFSPNRRAGRRLPTVGLVTALAGLGIALLALWRWRSVAGAADIGESLDPARYVIAMIAGFMLMLVGVSLTTPLMLSAMSKVSGALPVSLRIAVRDAARQRHRTAPVVASVLVAVAGSAVLAVSLASLNEQDRREYTAYTPPGVAVLQGNEIASNPGVDRAVELLGGSRIDVLSRLTSEDGYLVVQYVEGCTPDGYSGDGIGVDGPGLDAFVGGHGVEARGIMSQGKVVATGSCMVDSAGLVHVIESRYGTGEVIEHALPAVQLLTGAAAYRTTPAIIGAPSIAAQFPGFDLTADTALVAGPTPSERAVEQAQDALGLRAWISVERGFHSQIGPLFVGLIAAAGLITIAGVAVAVGLAAAESRADLATLAAVGASPHRRRTFAMGQAALVGALGAVLGCIVGCAMGFITISATGRLPLVIPVLPLGLIGIGVPLLAIVGAGLATRSRLPMVRRLA